MLLPFLFIFSSVSFGAQPKQCIEKIKPDLIKLLGQRFPDFHVPKLTELDQQSVNFDMQDGGDGCYAVAEGDFDGGQRKDVALLLASSKKSAPRLIVALQRDKSWAIYQLPTFCDTVKFCYVKPVKPGVYVRSAALDTLPDRPDERAKLTSRTTGVLSGELESTGIVYVYSKGHWDYVWISD